MSAARSLSSPHHRSATARDTLSLLLLVHLVTGCTAEAPWGAQGTVGESCYPEATCDRGGACVAGRCQAIGTSGRPGADGGTRPLPVGCPGLARPQLDAVPETTAHPRVALSGQLRAPAVALLIAGAGKQRLVPLPSDGQFCEELSLPGGQTTRFELLALDGQGCASAPTVVQIAQRPAAGSNVLAGIVPFANGEVRGALSRVSDGDVTTFSELAFRERAGAGATNSDCDNGVYIWFPLREPAEVSKLVVRYPSEGAGTRYLSCWSLLSSNATTSNVARPAIGATGWRALGGMQDGSGDDFLFSFPPQRVTQLALLLFEDGSDSDEETFAIAEIEALRSEQGPAFVGCPAR